MWKGMGGGEQGEGEDGGPCEVCVWRGMGGEEQGEGEDGGPCEVCVCVEGDGWRGTRRG